MNFKEEVNYYLNEGKVIDFKSGKIIENVPPPPPSRSKAEINEIIKNDDLDIERLIADVMGKLARRGIFKPTQQQINQTIYEIIGDIKKEMNIKSRRRRR